MSGLKGLLYSPSGPRGRSLSLLHAKRTLSERQRPAAKGLAAAHEAVPAQPLQEGLVTSGGINVRI